MADKKRKPNGYWRNWDNLMAVLQPIMEQNNGLIPGGSYFAEHGLTSIPQVIKDYYGGINAVRKRLGVEGLKHCNGCGQNLPRTQFRDKTKRRLGQRTETYKSNICKKCSSARVDDYRHTKIGRVRQTLRQIKYRAKIAGRECDLTEQWMMEHLEKIGWTCEMTGIAFDLYATGGGNQNQYTMSIDRIDSTRGYVIGNIQFLINWANRSKSDLPVEEFVKLCQTVASRSIT